MITAAWTFAGKWDPENRAPIKVVAAEIRGTSLILTFDEIVSVRGTPVFENAAGKPFRIFQQRFLDINRLTFVSVEAILPDDLAGFMALVSGDIIASTAYITERSIGASFAIPKVEQ